MSLAFDENGRPFIILREQEKKKRVKGLEAHKVSPCFNWAKLCLKIMECSRKFFLDYWSDV